MRIFQISWAFVLLLVTVGGRAIGSIAFVYENEAAVREGKAMVCPVTSQGVVVSAKVALASPKLLVGFADGRLRKAALVTWDAGLDMALIKPTDLIEDSVLQSQFQQKVASAQGFLQISSAPVSPVSPVSMEGAPFLETLALSTAPYQIKINKVELGSQPISLKTRFKKSEMTLELVRVSTTPVWYVAVTMTAEPSLSFWKKGRAKGLTDVPQPTFKYQQQLMFSPLASGKSFKIPIEIFYVKEERYVFHLQVDSKIDSASFDVPVVFKSK